MVESEYSSTSITNKEIKQLTIGGKEVAKIEVGDLILYEKVEENITNNKIDTHFIERKQRTNIYIYLEDINGNGLFNLAVTDGSTTYYTNATGFVTMAESGKTYIFEGNEQYNPSSISC